MIRLPAKPLLTAGAVLIALAATAFLPGLVVRPLHQDVIYVMAATSNLVHDGNLKNAGLFFAFQSLRPNFHSTQPFYAHYLAPVLYFWPFIKALGEVDAAFYLGQAVLLILLGTLLARAGLGWRGAVTAIALGVLTKTLIGSLITSPTQLMAICLIAYFWWRWEKPDRSRALTDGTAIAVAAFCRPEALFFGLLSAGRTTWRTPDKKQRIRQMAQTTGSALLGIVVIDTARRVLGGAGDTDTKLVLLMSDVLAPRFDTLSLAQFPPLSALLHEPYRSAFLLKIIRHLIEAFSPGTVVWGTWEILFAVCPLLLSALGWARLRTYAPLYGLLAFQLMVNAALIPLARHYDPAIFFLLCGVIRDVGLALGRVNPRWNGHAAAFLAAGSLLALGNSFIKLPRRLQEGLQLRAMQLRASAEAHRRVPRDAFVISDMPELWLWYGMGKMACLVPRPYPDTLQRVLDKFPEAYLVMFLGDEGAGYPLNPFRRPRVFTQQHVTIYGPRAGNPAAKLQRPARRQ